MLTFHDISTLAFVSEMGYSDIIHDKTLKEYFISMKHILLLIESLYRYQIWMEARPIVTIADA